MMRRPLPTLAFLLGFLVATDVAAAPGSLLGPSTQNAASNNGELVTNQTITNQVSARLRNNALAQWPQGRIEVQTQPPMNATQLAVCEDLEIEPRGSRTHGAIPVVVRCLHPHVWQLYFQAQVKVALPVWVAATPIARGDRLGGHNLRSEYRELAQMRRDYLPAANRKLEDIESLGLQVTRTVATGGVIYASLTAQVHLVQRGETVSISANRMPVRIGAQGEALESGTIGKQIRVRNKQSGREISAWIVAAGQVSSVAPTSKIAKLH